MYCPECGTKCAEGTSFCGNCGTRLPVVSAPVVHHKADLAHGVILTNIKALARVSGSGGDALRRLLADYAERSLERGIRYRVVDVSDYVFLNPAAGRNHRVSLSPTDSWVEHVAVLADHYRWGRGTETDQTGYLFIVGSDNVIPMPVVPHYVSGGNYDDTDIDSDLPYGYLMGEETYRMLRSGELFRFEHYYHVGRLPLAADASAHDLIGYLDRATEANGGVKTGSWYGQGNLPWHKESRAVCSSLRRLGLRTVADKYNEECALEGLFMSPPIVIQNTEQVFDPHADLYYFNLHGSDAPTVSGFSADNGKPPGKTEFYPAIDTGLISRVDTPNVFVTEACYGAKFKGYRRAESMLLTAMATRTLLYLGSSRVATCVIAGGNEVKLDHSDLLTKTWIDSLLEGYTAGEALFRGRQSFFSSKASTRLEEWQMASIVEFNIFGDPSLRVGVSGRGAKKSGGGTMVFTTGAVHTVVDRQCKYNATEAGESARPLSILDQVRGAVDRNLADIRDKVSKELYERLGVEPRTLSTIFRNRFSDGSEFLSFDYVDKTDGRLQLHIVMTDLVGNIQKVITTK